jgi:hypothetical protein
MAAGCFIENKFCQHHKLLKQGVSFIIAENNSAYYPVSAPAVPSIRLGRQSRTGMPAKPLFLVLHKTLRKLP